MCKSQNVEYLQCALNQRFSSTVKFPCTISSCGTKPIIFLYEWMDSFFPLIRIKPVILHPIAFPARAERKVVFPAPDGPITAVIRPGLILPVTHLNRCLFLAFKVRVRSLNEISIRGLFLISVLVANETTPENVRSLFCCCIAFSFSI